MLSDRVKKVRFYSINVFQLKFACWIYPLWIECMWLQEILCLNKFNKNQRTIISHVLDWKYQRKTLPWKFIQFHWRVFFFKYKIWLWIMDKIAWVYLFGVFFFQIKPLNKLRYKVSYLFSHVKETKKKEIHALSYRF